VQTARALIWQGGALWAVVATRPLVRACYALGDPRTPIVVSALGVAVFFGLATGLQGTMGHPAISAANAAASLVQLLLFLAVMRRKLPALPLRKIAVAALRSLLLAVPVAAGAASAALLLAPGSDAGTVARMLPGVAGLAVFTVGFAGLARGLRVPELMSVLAHRRDDP
jgi:putative peptidoglycan lipid II flippase